MLRRHSNSAMVLVLLGRALLAQPAGPPINITTGPLPDGTVGTAYSQTLAANGGAGALTWSITVGALPAGLRLGSDGTISGTPSAAGSSNFTVQAKDAPGNTGSKALSITVNATPLVVTTSSLPNGTVAAAYSQTLAASGGTGGYTWSMMAGTLPLGLALNNGTIAGTPLTPGTSTFTIQVKDSAGTTATKQLSITVNVVPVSITTSSLPNGAVGAAYGQTLAATGGVGGYTWSITAGALPASLNLSAGGSITGTPSAAGTATFTVQAQDTLEETATKQLSITVNPPLTVTTASLPNGTVGAAYSQTLAASGGTGGYTWSVSAGALPTGLTLSGATVGGTPSTAGTATFTVQVKDSSGTAATKQLSITVNPPPLTVTTTSLPNGMVGAAYSQTLAASGGTGGYTWSVSAGALPAGLTLSAATIGGTPSAAGAAAFTVQVKDSSGATAAKQLSITVNPPPLTVTTTSLPNGMVGAAYSQTLAASGGTGGYTWSVSAGALPAGLTLSAATIGGTPSAAGTATFTMQVQDTSGTTATKQLSITVNPPPLTVTTTSLPNGTVGVAYSQTLAASGGTGGYTWSVSAGALPAGLTLSGTTIGGTPSTAGAVTFTVQVQDSSGTTATKQLSITVNPPPLTVTTASLPNGTVGVAYSQTLAATGGTGGYTWSVSAGALPAGLTLSGTTIGGTPSTAGAATFTVQVQDTSGTTATKQLSITVNPPTLTITTTSLPNGTVGVAYSQTLAATGGTGGYTWSVSAGALPAGLTLSGTTIGGTPSTAGTATLTVQVQDTSGTTTTKQLSITVNPPTLTITMTSLPNATVGAAYSQTLAASGGTGGYTWSVSAGALPAGLTLSAATIGGTPSAAGTATFTVQVQDTSGTTATKQLNITVNPPTLTVTTTSLPNGTVGAAYSQTLAASGGTGGYTWSVSAGALPAGLTLSGATIGGTPSAAGTATLTVQVQDTSGTTATKQLNITVNPPTLTVTTTSLPNGTVGAAYSQTLAASGGTGGYSWSIATGSLPQGLTLSAATIGGTPSAAGPASFTVQVKDSSGAAATKPLTITINPPTLIITSAATLAAGVVSAPYTATLAASGGSAPYTWTLTSGTLPPGLSLSPAGVISGTPTAAGGFVFGVQVTDSVGGKAVSQAGIAIRGSLSITTPAMLATGSAGSPYTQTMSASGGTSPYTWSVISGALPAGISLAASSGVLSGTPTQTGAFPITLQVTDATSAAATGSFTLTVTNGMVIATAPVLPGATAAVPYGLTLTAAGGTAPYQWSITAGALPAGVNFSAAGQLSGTPTAAGNFSFTAQVADAAGRTVSKSFTLTVAPALTITTGPTLPPAAAGTSYRQALSASGGTQPYVWSVSAGALPGGLTLDASTGILNGTPAAAGNFSFTATVTDSNSVAAQQVFTLTVGQGMTVNAPATLPGAMAGSPYNFTLTATGGQQPYVWALSQGALPAGLSLDPASGTISGTATVNGNFAFTVQATDSSGLTAARAESLAVGLPALPAVSISGLPATTASLEQPLIAISLAQPFPVAITGVLNLAFTPAGNGPDDPAIQFSTGGRSATFTIPAGATGATFAAPFSLQTGSVAGTVTLSVTAVQANGVALQVSGNVTGSTQIPNAAPTVRSVAMTAVAGGFQVAIVGISNTRELTQATITFQPASGGSLQTGSLVVPLSDTATSWFQSATAAPYGGQFTLTIPFTVNGGSNAVGAVSVVLSNSVGDSAPVGSQ